MKITDDYIATWDGANWIVELVYLTKRVVIAGKEKGGKIATKRIGYYSTIDQAVKAVAEREASSAEDLMEFIERYQQLVKRVERLAGKETSFRNSLESNGNAENHIGPGGGGRFGWMHSPLRGRLSGWRRK